MENMNFESIIEMLNKYDEVKRILDSLPIEATLSMFMTFIDEYAADHYVDAVDFLNLLIDMHNEVEEC